MSQWPFIAASYALVAAGTIGLAAASLIAMRRAEAAADALRRP